MRRRSGVVTPVILALILSGAAAGRAAADEVRVAGPDGLVQFKLSLRDARLHYEVAFRDKPVIEPSPLAVTVDGVDITEHAALGDAKRYRVDETYPWRGVHATAANRCAGATVHLSHPASRTSYTLDVRAFNDAVAFRTVIDGAGGPRVPDEATRFTLPAGTTVWYHDLNGHYEGVHQKKDIAEVTAGEWAAPPLTVKLPGGAGYASITEAALLNYSGMALQADGNRGFNLVLAHKQPVSYPFKLRFSKEDIDRLAKPAAVTGTITTPWRVVMVGADLNALVNCDAVHDLCPPPDPKLFPQGVRTAWVKPGRAVWKYLDGGENSYEGMKEFCRLAGELGFEYNVLEGFWRRWTDDQLRALVAFGKERGVGLWLWRRSRDLRDPDVRRAFLNQCHDLGVAGVKLDFFDHEAKEMIDFYQVLLREAAEHQVMVNFHGSNKPTGEPRTWPNELVREAVRGMEASKLTARARHDTTLPFTRFLAGHADYTPVHFGARRGDTTWAHQVATAAVFTAPLLTYAAHPKTLLESPCAPMIKSIPAVWDETVVLPASEIGEVAAFARRSGDTWFLAVLNGPTARSVQVPLSFLGAGEYGALVVRDDKSDPAAVQVETGTGRRGDAVTIELRDGGGFIARYTNRR
jgi:alpha-glucosidase